MSPEEDENRPFLAMTDRKTKMVFAILDNERARNDASLKAMRRFFELLGYKKFICKSDGEPAMKALKKEAIKGLGGVEAVMEESPPDDRRANGEVEQVIKEIKREDESKQSHFRP